MLSLVAVLLLAVTVTHAQGSCPDGWRSHRGSCYLYMKEPYSWFDADRVCTALGGYLVEISSGAENEYLKGLIESQGGSYTWTGLQDFAEEGLYVWSHAHTTPTTFFWIDRQPDDSRHEEDCVALTKLGWADYNCEDQHLTFVCEIEPTQAAVIG